MLLAVVVGAWFLLPHSRITPANFDRIEEGMTKIELRALLGPPDEEVRFSTDFDRLNYLKWRNSPSYITVHFNDEDRVVAKKIRMASPWEVMRWYVERGAIKIGLKRDEGLP
jgi:hypothetical protein